VSTGCVPCHVVAKLASKGCASLHVTCLLCVVVHGAYAYRMEQNVHVTHTRLHLLAENTCPFSKKSQSSRLDDERTVTYSQSQVCEKLHITKRKQQTLTVDRVPELPISRNAPHFSTFPIACSVQQLEEIVRGNNTFV